ncbi:hypothetical protein [Acinetobacter ursingii]|uniref:hypothetical protein n=1 Tax=Acinetobacter ursingii TaxID=108980 RepID=UPI0021E2EBEB|nr:hypothetical protein [Acinetobacter ursingii]UYF78224.1 hypothetical protein LSO59_12390 [Acinetobacter ursingii]
MKTTYTITEKQNLNSQREGTQVECSTLTAAKRLASKNQAFHGTTLTIECNGSLIAYKNNGQKWVDLI